MDALDPRQVLVHPQLEASFVAGARRQFRMVGPHSSARSVRQGWHESIDDVGERTNVRVHPVSGSETKALVDARVRIK